MAIRYCGRVKINCAYRDRSNDYRCTFSIDGKNRGTVHVGVPGTLQHAVDSMAAYDDTTHAAIAFAIDDGIIDGSDLDFTTSGYHIRKTEKYPHVP